MKEYKDLYIFVSSTFEDMSFERDFLLLKVFPRIKEWCVKRGLIFHPVDLRWGITEEEAKELNKTIFLCLEKVSKSNPLFISFIGHRYGWIPKKEELNLDLFDENIYEKMKDKSATELEIYQALYSSFIQGKEKDCLFLIRNDSFVIKLKKDFPTLYEKFYEDDENSKTHLATLKEKILASKSKVIHYEPVLIADKSKDFQLNKFVANNKDLEDVIFDNLIELIKNNPEYKDYLEENELDVNEYYLERYSDSCPIQRIDELFEDSLKTPFKVNFISASKGVGISAASARFIKRHRKDKVVFYRFLNVNKEIEDSSDLIYSLALEVAKIEQIKEPIIKDYIENYKLVDDYINRLTTSENKETIILIDGIDEKNVNITEWIELLKMLPFKYLIATLDQKELDNYVENLTNEELFNVAKYKLNSLVKNLEDKHLYKLIDNCKGNAKHLITCLDYLVKFSKYERMDSDIDLLAKMPQKFLFDLIHGKYVAGEQFNEIKDGAIHILSWLAYGDYGLTENDIAELLQATFPKQDKNKIDKYVRFFLKYLSDDVITISDGSIVLTDESFKNFLIDFAQGTDFIYKFVNWLVDKIYNIKEVSKRYFDLFVQSFLMIQYKGDYLETTFANLKYLYKHAKTCGLSHLIKTFRKLIEKFYNIEKPTVVKSEMDIFNQSMYAKHFETATFKKDNYYVVMYYALLSLSEEDLSSYTIFKKNLAKELGDDINHKVCKEMFGKMILNSKSKKPKSVLLKRKLPDIYFNSFQAALYDKKIYALEAYTGYFCIIDIFSGEIEKMLRLNLEHKPKVLFRENKHIYIICEDNVLYLYSILDGSLMPFTFNHYNQMIVDSYYSQDSKMLFLFYSDYVYEYLSVRNFNQTRLVDTLVDKNIQRAYPVVDDYKVKGTLIVAPFRYYSHIKEDNSTNLISSMYYDQNINIRLGNYYFDEKSFYYYDEKEQLIKYDFKTETKEVIDYKTEHQCFDMVYDTYITVTKEDDLVIGDEVIYGAEGMPTAILSHRIDRVLVVDEYLYYLNYDYLVTKKRKIKV